MIYRTCWLVYNPKQTLKQSAHTTEGILFTCATRSECIIGRTSSNSRKNKLILANSFPKKSVPGLKELAMSIMPMLLSRSTNFLSLTSLLFTLLVTLLNLKTFILILTKFNNIPLSKNHFTLL